MMDWFLNRLCPGSVTQAGITLEEDDTASASTISTFPEIGKGQCGTVYSFKGTNDIFKVANPNKEDQLRNDHHHHLNVFHALNKNDLGREIGINVPRSGRLIIPSDTSFWDQHLHKFPPATRPIYTIQAERIEPLPFEIRSALFDLFAPRRLQRKKEAILADKCNEHCLVRPYLGRRAVERTDRVFRLRNLDLTVDEMETIGLAEMGMCARVMAETLAVLHWRVGIDANDVEFVLACPRISQQGEPSGGSEQRSLEGPTLTASKTRDPAKWTPTLWLLDFDQCKTFQKDKEGLAQLVRAFFFNDPYYPRPNQDLEIDRRLWSTFKECYLAMSERLTWNDMPKAFVEEVEDEASRRKNVLDLFR